MIFRNTLNLKCKKERLGSAKISDYCLSTSRFPKVSFFMLMCGDIKYLLRVFAILLADLWPPICCGCIFETTSHQESEVAWNPGCRSQSKRETSPTWCNAYSDKGKGFKSSCLLPGAFPSLMNEDSSLFVINTHFSFNIYIHTYIHSILAFLWTMEVCFWSCDHELYIRLLVWDMLNWDVSSPLLFVVDICASWTSE